MNADLAPGGRQPSDQTNRFGLGRPQTKQAACKCHTAKFGSALEFPEQPTSFELIDS